VKVAEKVSISDFLPGEPLAFAATTDIHAPYPAAPAAQLQCAIELSTDTIEKYAPLT
jgi:hypothetical protein